MASNGTAHAVLALALARGMSYAEAAESAGIGKRTVVRRMAEPSFRVEVQRLRSELMDAGAGRLADTVSAAVRTLATILDACTDDAVRARAANALLTHAVRFREAVDLEARLAVLEARLAAMGGSDDAPAS